MLIGVSGGSGSHALQLVAEHIRTDIGFVMFQIRTTKIINAKGISRAEFSLEDVVILLASIAQVTKSVKKCSTLWLCLKTSIFVCGVFLYIIYFQVNGMWGGWNEWESCTVTCGGGSQTRTRQCLWPDANNKGKHCNFDGSDSVQSRECGINSCPGKNRKFNIWYWSPEKI